MNASVWMIAGGVALLTGAVLIAGLILGDSRRGMKAGDWIAWAGVLTFAAGALVGGWLGGGLLRDALLVAAPLILAAGLWLRQRRDAAPD